jgi:hypothetical protein
MKTDHLKMQRVQMYGPRDSQIVQQDVLLSV